jgi:hypothetical protein
MRISAELQTRLGTLFRRLDKAGAQQIEVRRPIIVDIPFRKLEVERRSEPPLDPLKLPGRCLRVSPSGRVCGRPTVGSADDCLRHLRWYEMVPAGIPYPDDADALVETMARVMSLVMVGQMTPQQANAVAKLGAVIQRTLEKEDR